MDFRCAECKLRADRRSCQLMLDAPCDHRTATVMVLAVQRILERITPSPTDGNAVFNLAFRDADSITGVFGADDAALAIHAGSRYWAALGSMASSLQRAGGVSCEFVGMNAWRMKRFSTLPPGPMGAAGASASTDNSSGLPLPLPCCPCALRAIRLSWSEHQAPALVQACGALLRDWFPAHAVACKPCWGKPSLGRLSAANRQAAAGIILGGQERRLVDSLLQNLGGVHSRSDRVSPLPAPGASGNGVAELQQLQAAAMRTHTLIAALPLCWQVQWRSFGRYERQGQALLTLTNGCGVFLVVDVRSVPLVRTGNKARGASLSRPGRFGQAAKASKGPPGQSEDLALWRRRQKRRATAGAAVKFVAELVSGPAVMQCQPEEEGDTATSTAAAAAAAAAPVPAGAAPNGQQAVVKDKDVEAANEHEAPGPAGQPALLSPSLPPGAVVFPALLTSDLEGLQVASSRIGDKARQAAMLGLLLGLPEVSWPEVEEGGGRRGGRGKGSRRAGRRKARADGVKSSLNKIDEGSNCSGEAAGSVNIDAAVQGVQAIEGVQPIHDAWGAGGGSNAQRKRRRRGRRGRREQTYAEWLSGLWSVGSGAPGAAAAWPTLPASVVVVVAAAAAGIACYMALFRRTAR